jgi:hypothetical protein
MLNEELEPEQTAVGEDDPFAIHTIKKKKKKKKRRSIPDVALAN